MFYHPLLNSTFFLTLQRIDPHADPAQLPPVARPTAAVTGPLQIPASDVVPPAVAGALAIRPAIAHAAPGQVHPSTGCTNILAGLAIHSAAGPGLAPPHKVEDHGTAAISGVMSEHQAVQQPQAKLARQEQEMARQAQEMARQEQEFAAYKQLAHSLAAENAALRTFIQARMDGVNERLCVVNDQMNALHEELRGGREDLQRATTAFEQALPHLPNMSPKKREAVEIAMHTIAVNAAHQQVVGEAVMQIEAEMGVLVQAKSKLERWLSTLEEPLEDL